MTEEVEALTFPMSRESESASRLKTIISYMLPRFSDDYIDDVLSEYVTVLVCNGKSQGQTREDLDAFLGEQSWGFVACLWELLLKYFSLGKQENSASVPRTGVDFGSHDTLIKQDLSSRKYDDCDQKATDATNSMNEQLISVTAPIEDVEAPVSPKVKNMRMLRQELIDIPCRRAQPKEKEYWNSSGYSRKILRSVIVTIKQPCGRNPAKYEKVGSPWIKGVEFYRSAQTCQKEKRVLNLFLQEELCLQDPLMHLRTKKRCLVLVFGIDWAEQAPNVFLTQKSLDCLCLVSRHRKTKCFNSMDQHFLQRIVNNIARHFKEKFLQLVTGTEFSNPIKLGNPRVELLHPLNLTLRITSVEMHYGIINANPGEFSSVLQNKQAEQDVGKPSLLSYQSLKSDLFSEKMNLKEKLQQLELRINQSKQLKKQKVEELKRSPQSGESQYQQDVTESRIIHVTNVHYAAKKEAISMFFSSKCGAVENITIVTDPVTRHPKGTVFVTFATKESISKAIALSGTMFYSRPIKIARYVIASGVVSAPQIVTGS